MLRSWYEKNKHIFPASRWEPYDPEKKWDKYTVWKPSSAGWKPSRAGRLEAHPAPLCSPPPLSSRPAPDPMTWWQCGPGSLRSPPLVPRTPGAQLPAPEMGSDLLSPCPGAVGSCLFLS